MSLIFLLILTDKPKCNIYIAKNKKTSNYH